MELDNTDLINLAHEIFAEAQLTQREGVEDAVIRIVETLKEYNISFKSSKPSRLG